MRVATAGRRSERGATLIIMTVFIVVAVIFVAIVVDLGDLRQNRRQLTTATDAAALDVAQTVAIEWSNPLLRSTILDGLIFGSTYRCDSLASQTVRKNNEGLDPDSLRCEVDDRGWYAVVTVSVSEVVDYSIGRASGADSAVTAASTSVVVKPESDGGLRPFALCSNQADMAAWIAGGAEGEPIIDLTADKSLNPFCGTAYGNWGLVDFPDTGNGSPGVGNALENGTSTAVTTAATPTTCVPTSPVSCLDAETGAKWNAKPVTDGLDFLEGPTGCPVGGIEFFLPVYSQVVSTLGGPGGTKTGFPVVGFAKVQLMCYSTLGADLNSLTLKLLEYHDDGPCCGLSEFNRTFEICDVGTLSGAVGSTFSSECEETLSPTTTTPDDPVPVNCVLSSVAVSPAEPRVQTSGTHAGKIRAQDLVLTITTNDSPACASMTVAITDPSSAAHVSHSACCTPTTGGEYEWREAAQSHTGWTAGTAYTVTVTAGSSTVSGSFTTRT